MKSQQSTNPDMPTWAAALCIGLVLLLPIYVAVHVGVAALEYHLNREARESMADRQSGNGTAITQSRARTNF